MFSDFIFFVLSVDEGWFLQTAQEPTRIFRPEGQAFFVKPERMATGVPSRGSLARACASAGFVVTWCSGIFGGRESLRRALVGVSLHCRFQAIQGFAGWYALSSFGSV